MRYLGIDFGEKRIGLAVCDPTEAIVSPFGRIDRRSDEQAVEQVLATIAQESIGAVVVGLPANMDGTEGPQARRVRGFIDLLGRQLSVPLHVQNEQLSSFAADQRLAERDLTRGRNRQRQDAIAAAVILEDFLRNRTKD